MTFAEFAEYRDKLLAQVTGMDNTKGREYAHDTERFANFKRLGEQLGISPLIVAWIYTYKHIDSIASYIKKGKTFSTEPIEGRIVDVVTYMLLIAGLIKEKE